ncbi:MAG TPA: hypothetical protein VMT24_07470, partial [Aggregatilineaceae bacterium]|nr:hypothetical protein [Aggregatilineaceae bacterium]
MRFSRQLIAMTVVIGLLLTLGVSLPGSVAGATVGTGGRIAFEYSNAIDHTNGIATVNADGTDFNFLGPGINPRWSPDGSEIAYRAAPGGDLAVMNADGSDKRTLVQGALALGNSAPDLAWSPDGSQIAYLNQPSGGGNYTIWVTGSEGQNPHQLFSSTALSCCESLDWSPDGNVLLFSALPGTGSSYYDLFTVNVHTLALSRITHTANHSENWARWSPDGQQIVFDVVNTQNDSDRGMRVTDASGGSERIISNGTSKRDPVWSPDGTRILYDKFDSQGHYAGKFAMSLAGGQETAVYTAKPGDFTKFADWTGYSPVQVEFTQAIQQLQTLAQLDKSLATSGGPPVPIVAGKAAVMRVIFNEVQQNTDYVVRVNGAFSSQHRVTLIPGCTAEDRRNQQNHCDAVNFYFTPPAGQWTEHLTVEDPGSGNVVLHEDFNLTSVKSKDITLKAVSVCDSQDAAGNWQCQDQTVLPQLSGLMRAIFPTANLKVIVTPLAVRERVSDFPRPIDWWSQVDLDLAALYDANDSAFAQLGIETYYVGTVRSGGALPGGILGTAFIGSRGAAAQVSDFSLNYQRAPAIFAHEVGHAIGLDHTNTAAPGLSFSTGAGCWLGTRNNLPPYPYSDNDLRSGGAPGKIETGFDVANQVALPGDAFYDIMGYCGSPAPSGAADDTQWITPFSYTQLLSPAGPLSLGPVKVQDAPSTSSPSWLIRGTIDQATATLGPLFAVDAPSANDAGTGSYRIEVRDASDSLLFTRMFDAPAGHGSPGPGQEMTVAPQQFSEIIPVQAGAASIQIFDPFNTQIGSLTLAGAAPQVTIDPVQTDGTIDLSWSVSDPDSTSHTYWVDYSPDGGQTWENQAMDLKDASLKLDASTLAGSDNAVFRVIGSDGVNSGEATSQPFSVGKKLPQAEIIGPEAHSFRTGDLVWLQGAAWDADDGSLDGDSIRWSSDKDGTLGTGASLPVYDLSAGTHTITMTATDSDHNSVSKTMTVAVSDASIVEGEQPGTP